MPGPEGYDKALGLAWEAVRPYSPETLAASADCQLSKGRLVVPVLNGRLLVDLENRTMASDLPERNVFLDILVLHYLAGCARSPQLKESSNWQMFRQLPGGEAFQAAFHQRIIKEMAMTFSGDPSRLVRAAAVLGGRMEGASAYVRLPFLPKLPVKVIVWPGDDEVPGSANMLFPLHSALILPTEDHAEVGTIVLAALRRALLSSDR